MTINRACFCPARCKILGAHIQIEPHHPQEVVFASISTVRRTPIGQKAAARREFLLEISRKCRYNKAEVV